MDANQFKMFLEHQTNVMRQMLQEVYASSRNAQAAPRQQQPSAASVQVPKPSPLALEGDMGANFEFFEKSWNDYARAIGMDRWPQEDNSQKVSFLLTVVGEPARKKYFNFELTAEQKATPEAALAAIKAKVVTKRNVIIDRLDFFSEAQSTGESIDDFVSRLKVMAKSAKLGALETELVTYKVVTANKWQHLRSQMLTSDGIDLNKAVDLCRAHEITARHSHELGALVPAPEVNRVKEMKNRTKSSRTQRCKFCGDIHGFDKSVCPAFGRRCHRCNGRNHFERVCRAEVKSKSRIKKAKSDSASETESSTSEESEGYDIGKIFDYSNHEGNVFTELELKIEEKWKPVLCDVDTGANTSLIGHATLVKLTGNRNTSLLPSSFHLQSFGGSPIHVLGQVKVPCRRLGRKFKLVLQVVDVDHRPLLSARASHELGLVKFSKTVSVGTSAVVPPEDCRNVHQVEARMDPILFKAEIVVSGAEDQSLVNLKSRKEPTAQYRSSPSEPLSEPSGPTKLSASPSTRANKEKASHAKMSMLQQREAWQTWYQR